MDYEVLTIKLYVKGVVLYGLIEYSSCFALRESKISEVLSHTYLLTPWSRVLLEKLTDFQLVKKFPEFYGTRRFINPFTNARQLSLF